MQEIQSIDGGVGRLFGRGGGEGGGERRWKPHQYHQGFAPGGHGYQALKCPRCDSLNTKFCYYNNYNLSQPRYFCKGCRRYWTKGGVLRNVPVGGGCRKNKRSKQKSGSNGDPSSSMDVAPTTQRKSSDSLNSSSDSSSLTANTSPSKAKAPTPFTLSEAQPTRLINFQESSTEHYTVPQSSTQNQSFPSEFDKYATDHHHMFSEIETFKSLLTSSSDQLPRGFNFNPAPEVSSLMEQQDDEQVVEKQESKWKQWMDETYTRTSNGGVAVEDWEGGGGAEDGLFDQSYWSQNPWSNYFH